MLSRFSVPLLEVLWCLARRPIVRVVLVLTLVALPARDAFACSDAKRFACGLLEAGCFPGALGGRDAFLQCVAKISNNDCNECISGSPGNPICWDGSSSQQAGNCGGVSGREYGLSVPRGFSANTVAPNQDGHLELVVRQAAGIGHLWQRSPSGLWTADAVDFPASPTTTFAPTIVRHIDGRLEIFVVANDRSVRRISQVAPNVNWGSWEATGGLAAISSVSAAIDATGRTSIVALGADKNVWIASSSDGGAMKPWVSLKGTMGGPPTIALNADGRREVFEVGNDGALWHTWELGADQWSNWASFGGGGSFVGTPVVGLNADGRLEVFATTSTGVLRHVWQVGPNIGWSAWADFPGTHKYSISVFPNVNGSLTVYAVGVLDSAVWYITQDFSTASWGNWHSLGGSVLSNPRVAINANGTLEIFAVGQDRSVWHNKQASTNGLSWSGWQRVGGSGFTEVF